MNGIPSKSQLEKLGRRLRKAELATEADLEMLQEFRAAHDPALAHVEDELRAMGLRPSSRLKTPNTIIEKLVRDKTRLGTMQDIAGVRLVDDMTLGRQDDLVGRILQRLGGNVVDRRSSPSHGYRAVHVIVAAQSCLVEIQVRTLLQNLWAQIMEVVGDRIGRGIRYGELPDEPAVREAVERLIQLSDVVAGVEAVRADLENRERQLLETAPEGDESEAENQEVVTVYDLKKEVTASELLLKKMLKDILKSLEGGEST